MANSIDLGALAIGVALGYGLKNEIKDAGSICKASLLGGLTSAAVAAVAPDAAARATEQMAQAAAEAAQQAGAASGQAAGAAPAGQAAGGHV